MATRVLIWHTLRIFSHQLSNEMSKSTRPALDFLGISDRQASIQDELHAANEKVTLKKAQIANVMQEQEAKISEAKERLKRKIEEEKKRMAEEIEGIKKYFRIELSIHEQTIAKVKDDISRLKGELASTEEVSKDIQEHAIVTGNSLCFSSPKSRIGGKSMNERDASWEQNSRARAAAFLDGLNGAVVAYFQPIGPGRREVANLREFIPEITARTCEGIDKLVAANNEDDYATVCSLDNLDAAEKLVFSDKPSSFLKRCFFSSLASPDASYRMSGYLYQRLMADTDVDDAAFAQEMIAVWTLGFQGLDWTPTDWLDSLRPGPAYTTKLRDFCDPLERRIPAVPESFRARSCQYLQGTLGQLLAQRFRFQASKLFVICGIAGPGAGFLVERVRSLLGPRGEEPRKPVALTIDDFAIRHSRVSLSVQAIVLAKQVVERLVGYYMLPKEFEEAENLALDRATRAMREERAAREARREEEEDEEIVRSFRAKIMSNPKEEEEQEVLDLT